jgi:DNA mismatch endonuclease (patch repair protein)
MSRVKSKNTGPEITVRKLVYGLGYRYRLHDASLPGKPDLVFRTRRKVIFVNGCFWHSHKDCPKARTPKTRQDFWKNKMQKNAKRDEENQNHLGRLGWKCLVIWQCQTKDLESLEKLIIEFLGD